MTLAASSGTSERFILDAASFERFLAAAWVLQCQRERDLLKLQLGLGGTSTTTQEAEHTLDNPVDGEFPVGAELREKRDSALSGSSLEVWTALSKFGRKFNPQRHTLRVSLPPHAIRSVAIAAPILALAILSAWLLVETRRGASAQTTQVISQATVAPAEAARTGVSTLLTTIKNGSQELGKTANSSPPPQAALLQSTHLRVTDSATASLVQELSPYEIQGLRRRARYEDSSAAFALGMVYETGRHFHQSCVEAARWVAKAAAAGNAAAQYNLGLRYQIGDGVRANSEQSRKWLRKAAHRNPNAKPALNLLASR